MLELLSTPSSVHVVPTLTLFLVSVGTLVLAAADIWRQEVEDWATVILLAVAAGGMLWEGISAGQWISGALSAAIAFLIYLALGMRGVMGGGDVKLSVVPALVLGAWSPFLGLWWIAASILIQQVFFWVASRNVQSVGSSSRTEPVALPHVPAMAAALLAASVIFPT